MTVSVALLASVVVAVVPFRPVSSRLVPFRFVPCRPDSVPSQSDAARDRSGCSLALLVHYSSPPRPRPPRASSSPSLLSRCSRPLLLCPLLSHSLSLSFFLFFLSSVLRSINLVPISLSLSLSIYLSIYLPTYLRRSFSPFLLSPFFLYLLLSFFLSISLSLSFLSSRFASTRSCVFRKRCLLFSSLLFLPRAGHRFPAISNTRAIVSASRRASLWKGREWWNSVAAG